MSLVRVFDQFLYRSYTEYADFIHLPLSRLPIGLRIVLAVMIADFLEWAAHIVHHKVRVLWRLHSVHHSQPELNAFSDQRIHPVEYLTDNFLQFLPLVMLNFGVSFSIWYTAIRLWHSRLTHANVRTNFGIFRFILVTPQSHRVHHSIERRHWDCNYGGLLSIWDHLFGTQYRGYDEYPATGVQGSGLPLETSARPLALLRTYGATGCVSLPSRDEGSRRRSARDHRQSCLSEALGTARPQWPAAHRPD